MMTIEKIGLKNLLKNEQYLRKCLPYVKAEYYQEKPERIIFEEIQSYVKKYNTVPSWNALAIAIANRDDLFETEFKDIEDIIVEVKANNDDTDIVWLTDATEKWCQERALHNAVLESIQIMDGKNKHKSKGAIPSMLSDALAVSFDPNIGHDYFADADKRFEFYHRKAKKYPFDLDYFNRITGGGLEPKTLSIILAGVNCGKSLMMCHFAAAFLSQHLNVLYITLEMCEERITQRIEANLMDITIDDLNQLPKDMFDKRITNLRNKYKGELIVHEYPTACASVDHFRALLQELAMKKKFRPDIVFVDYINLCQSARVKQGNNVNSYTLVKSIAEELRGMAVEFGFPIVSATQLTRSGYDSSDPGLTDTSESFGLPATADLMFAITTSEELDKLGQIAIKQLKNRDNDVTTNKRFVIGINRSKMKLYDVPENQQNLQDAENDEVGQRSRGAYDKFRVDSPINRFD